MTTRSRTHGLRALVAGTAAALVLGACGGSGFTGSAAGTTGPSQQSGKASLKVLVATGGTADLDSVRKAAAAWAQKTGNTIEVSPAQDQQQQLAQGFAAGNPPDVFFLDASLFPTYAKAGNLFDYGDQIKALDFYPALKQSFTYKGSLYCAPKDFSNLGLVINTDLWAAAGLTDADTPKTWAQLESVARRLTTKGVVGLGLGDTHDRVDAFLKQAGGTVTNADQTQVTADTPANVAGLTFVQKLLAEKVAAFPKQLDSGWSGEALGKGKAAMVVEGNWFTGAAAADYPKLKWRVAELPAGPAGRGTLTFTQCWGVAQAGKHHEQSVDFVKSLFTTRQQLAFASAFGVMPSLMSARSAYAASIPASQKAWLAGAEYAVGPVSAPGLDPVMKDFDTRLQGLPGASPAAILATVQKNGAAALRAGG